MSQPRALGVVVLVWPWLLVVVVVWLLYWVVVVLLSGEVVFVMRFSWSYSRVVQWIVSFSK